MPSRVPGNSSWTAWAIACAAEWRMTARPSGDCAATASTSVVVVGRPGEVLERAVGVADHDGAVRAGQLDPGLAQGVQRRRTRGDPDGLDGLGRTGAGGQQDLLGAVGRADRSPWMLMR